ncbi:hypothetical protein KY284_027497 [Solanum tuberosum]|nr:hypothetical protein KY284_027497 [Solanum tuberosum]
MHQPTPIRVFFFSNGRCEVQQIRNPSPVHKETRRRQQQLAEQHTEEQNTKQYSAPPCLLPQRLSPINVAATCVSPFFLFGNGAKFQKKVVSPKL